MAEALDWLDGAIGPDAVETTLRRFVDEFPPVAVYQKALTVEEYLAGETDGVAHRQAALEEMLMLWLANLNPAFAPFRELFDDAPLAASDRLSEDHGRPPRVLRRPALLRPRQPEPHRPPPRPGPGRARFSGRPARFHPRPLGPRPGPADLCGCRRASTSSAKKRKRFSPARARPGLRSSAPTRRPPRWPCSARHCTAGCGASPEPEPERFSLDLDWMPNLVLIAKNTYVWLDQLSKKYQRPITRLDQIPDEELDALRAAGLHRPLADRPLGAQPRPRSASSR